VRAEVRLKGNEACRARLRLALLRGIPRGRLLELLKKSGSPEALLELPLEDEEGAALTPVESSVLASDLSSELGEQARLGTLAEACITAWTDEEFPTLLRHIYHPPLCIFWRGNVSAFARPAIAIVGSRKCSPSGRVVAERLARALAAEGFAVVSGMARGIDSAAHRGALAARGVTVAVLGCGVDVCYPAENRGLMGEILERGVVVSEFEMGAPPLRQNFPLRNRLVSGLSLGVIVVEAGEASGALTTVKHALAQNREVFVVPGDTISTSTRGSNKLLKEGATPVTCVEDVLEELKPGVGGRLEPITQSAVPEAAVSGTEEALLECLSHVAAHVDDICKAAGREPSAVLSQLLSLELKGLVRQEPGNRFFRVDKR
jgi:DNA processing protein